MSRRVSTAPMPGRAWFYGRPGPANSGARKGAQVASTGIDKPFITTHAQAPPDPTGRGEATRCASPHIAVRTAVQDPRRRVDEKATFRVRAPAHPSAHGSPQTPAVAKMVELAPRTRAQQESAQASPHRAVIAPTLV